MDDSLIDSALGYAAMGWPVLPLHSFSGGICSCRNVSCKSPGKHPRITKGLLGASTDPKQIGEWWRMWPNANIGIVTGAESGIIVIDVDELKEAEATFDQHPLPPTVSQSTGKGQHFIFKHPGVHIKTVTKPVPGIDSKGDGGYIVAPPSIHYSGVVYKWIISPDQMDPAPAPKWWIDRLSSSEEHVSTRTNDTSGRKFGEGERNNGLTSVAGSLRKAGLGYEALLPALIAKNNQDCIPPLDIDEVTSIAQSVCNYAVESEEDAELARQGKAIYESWREYRQLEVAEKLKIDKKEKAGPAPDGFMPPRGLIRDIANHILDTSITPQPLMAMASAVCLVSVLCGRKYRTWTDARPNIYMVALAGSGSGKDHPRKIIKEIMSRCNLDKHLGGSRIASGPGLFAAMIKDPVKIFLLDEFGMTLQAINSRTAPGYLREIAQTLMELYSSAASEMKSAEYSDQKTRPVETIKNPCTVLYATSTHGQFYDAITSDHAASGQIARLMIINTPHEIPEDSEDFVLCPVPDSILESVNTLYKAKTDPFLDNIGSTLSPDPYTVPVSDDVKQAWKELRKSMREQSRDEASASVYQRVAENAVKLALVYACSMDPEDPYMDVESFVWGRDLALWSANTLMEQYNRYSFDTETEKYSKQIEEFVRKFKGEGVAQSVLDQRMGRKFKDYEWESHLKQLVRSGIILKVDFKDDGKPGARKSRILHREYFDDSKHEAAV